MGIITIVIAVVAAYLAYRLGYHEGERKGASAAQRALIEGATSGLSDARKNELAEWMGELSQRAPSSKLKNIDAFVERATELGGLLATINRDHGAAS
jgi:hypothetical protein